jgi:SAM-dependent methyltransferase
VPFDVAHWNQRYGTPEYCYGTEPNDFLRERAVALPIRGRVLCLGEGEGRNAVFLASLGFEVVAVDASAVGLAKAERLAHERGVRITTVLADLADFDLGRDAWDGIVSIWCHMAQPLRSRVHHAVTRALKTGGAFLLEAYAPAQLALGTGGPKTIDLLASLAELRQDLAGIDLEVAVEREREVHEGRGHGGRSAVVQLVARKAPLGGDRSRG